MFKNIIIYMALLIFMSSCNRTKENTINCNVTNISINPLLLNNSLSIDDYTVNKIIRLSVPNGKVIGKVNKCILHNNKIYILDNEFSKTIFIFDGNGNFIRNLGDVGKSQEEFYRAPTDFAIDRKNEDVYIFENESKKIVIFDKNGKFKEIIRFEKYWPYAFALLENNNLALAFRMKNKFLSQDYELTISNKSEQSISNYGKLEDNYLFTPGYPFCESENELFFIPNFCDTVYAIKNDTISRAIAINFGNLSMPEMIRNEIKAKGDPTILKNIQCVNSINNYFENDYWINVQYDYSSLGLNYFKNKTTGQEFNNISLFSGFIPNKILSIIDDTFLFAITEEDVMRYNDLKNNNEEVWKTFCEKTDDKILNIFNKNNDNFELTLLFIKIKK